MKYKCDVRILYYPLCALLIAALIFWNYFGAWFALNKLNMNDFGKFYYSTINFIQNIDMYGPNPATLIPISQSEYKHFWNMNPPHFHLLITPFSYLSPVMAFSSWIVAGFICILISMSIILKEIDYEITPISLSVVLMSTLAFSGTYTTLVTGQISFFLFLFVTLAWLSARRGKWIFAAIFVGICISVKSFFLILVPFLMVRRQSRSALLALLCAVTIFIAGIFIFGLKPYIAWFEAMASMDWAWASMNGSILGMLTRILSPSPHYLHFMSAHICPR